MFLIDREAPGGLAYLEGVWHTCKTVQNQAKVNGRPIISVDRYTLPHEERIYLNKYQLKMSFTGILAGQ